MEQTPQSASANANDLVERLVAQEKEKQETEKSESEKSLKQKIDDETKRSNGRLSEKKDASRLSDEIKLELSEKKTNRKKIQTEGKDATKVLRASPASKKALENKDSQANVVNEVFGEAIVALKSINEEVKAKRVELEQILAKEQERSMAFWRETKEKSSAFEAEYPNIVHIFDKVKMLESWTEGTKLRLETINRYAKEQEGHLDDTIVYDPTSYYNVRDITLETQLAEVEKEVEVIKSEKNQVETELREVKEKGKSFFQSRSVFEAGLQKLEQQMSDKENEIRAHRYNSEETGTYDLSNKREKLSTVIKDVLGMYRNYNSDDSVIGDAKTLGGLFESARIELQARLNDLELKDEEKLVYELYKTFNNSIRI